MDDVVTAALAIIGDEILSGRTEDANLAYLARWLNEEGIRLTEVRVVADDEVAIGKAINALRNSHDYLFTTGGIGPTHDDITVDSIAVALGLGVECHPQSLAMLEDYYGKDALTDDQKRMARVPAGADLIPNPMSGAPGIRIDNIFVLAGIPGIMRGMLEGLRGQLIGGTPMQSDTIVVYAPESDIAGFVRQVQDQNPDVSVGSYPFFRKGRVGAALVVRGTESGRLAEVLAALTYQADKLGLESEAESTG
ncbi:MAG: competence/damage-inducible protein A [Halieaceae bacterium]|jgi:molybdenum cofactor synthesis domain-containing protein|nr:competence/damage-inducible protein A [Halieaceae bacterium]